jgi:CRISPR/Cas system endoribonuclease Cas6 (RAMP superfamily)
MKDSDLTESDEKFVSELKEKLKNKNYEFKAENTTKNVDWKSKRLVRKLPFLIIFLNRVFMC